MLQTGLLSHISFLSLFAVVLMEFLEGMNYAAVALSRGKQLQHWSTTALHPFLSTIFIN